MVAELGKNWRIRVYGIEWKKLALNLRTEIGGLAPEGGRVC